MKSMCKSRLPLWFSFFALIVMMTFASCNRTRPIDISNSNSLELSPGVDWALVSEPYAAFREEPSFESAVVSHARRGEIMQVLGNRYVTTGTGRNSHTSVWYYFEQGWLDESLVTIFDNKFKAEKAALVYNVE